MLPQKFCPTSLHGSVEPVGASWNSVHTHGTPDLETSGHYEPLMDGGSPYEPLDDGSGTDWLFVWVP